MAPATHTATPSTDEARTSRVLLVSSAHRVHRWSSGIVRADDEFGPSIGHVGHPAGVRHSFTVFNWAALGTGIGLGAVGMIRASSAIGPFFVAVGFGAVAMALLLPMMSLVRGRKGPEPLVGQQIDTNHALVAELVDRYEIAHAAADRRGVEPLIDLSYAIIHAAATRLDGRPPVFEGELDVVRAAIRDLDAITDGLI